MQPLRCVLLGTEIVPAADEVGFIRWHQLLENRRIAYTTLGEGRFVSTIFLGENRGTDAKPEWFETLIAGVPTLRVENNQYLLHSGTYAAAMAGHQAMVDRAAAQLNRKKTPSA